MDDRNWDFWWNVGARRTDQKKGYESSDYLEEYAHELGAIGEYHFGRLVGKTASDDLNPLGDRGFDFPNVEVKATSYTWEPWLKVRKEKAQRGMYYALVTVNARTRFARYIGYADFDMLTASEPVRLRRRKSKRSAVTGRKRCERFGPLSYVLKSGLFTGLPPGYRSSVPDQRS